MSGGNNMNYIEIESVPLHCAWCQFEAYKKSKDQIELLHYCMITKSITPNEGKCKNCPIKEWQGE